jgi:hypothetical protein
MGVFRDCCYGGGSVSVRESQMDKLLELLLIYTNQIQIFQIKYNFTCGDFWAASFRS